MLLISAIFSSRDGRHLGDARHDGFRPDGRGHASSPCVRRRHGHSVDIRDHPADSDSHSRSSNLHGSRL